MGLTKPGSCRGLIDARQNRSAGTRSGTGRRPNLHPIRVRLQCALALLAIRPREVIQRDELIEELGLNETTKDTINALHAHVRRLRQWLDTEGATSNILQTAGRSGYFLDIHRRDVDAHLFIDAVNEAVTLQNKVPSIAVAMLENALAQWRARP